MYYINNIMKNILTNIFTIDNNVIDIFYLFFFITIHNNNNNK